MSLIDPPALSEAVTRISMGPTFAAAGVPLKFRVDPLKTSQDGSTLPFDKLAVYERTVPGSGSEKVFVGKV